MRLLHLPYDDAHQDSQTNRYGTLRALVVLAPAQAQDREAELLAELREAPESESKRLERELELIWGNSGSPAMDLLLKRGRDALVQQRRLLLRQLRRLGR